ncbi:hypothetical protein D1007_16258 [Hordeum vulgare]|nr:hypothetical protein D1007_16258 [Hordeum vulgare]
MPEKEATHLECWKTHSLAKEAADSQRKMQWEQKEEARVRRAAIPPPQHTLEEAIVAAYQAAFGWVGPPSTFIDLTNNDNDDKGKGKGKVNN